MVLWSCVAQLVFIHAIRDRLESGGDPEKKLKELFDKIDEDGSGIMDRSEFAGLLKALQVPAKMQTKKSADELWKSIDEDGSGEVPRSRVSPPFPFFSLRTVEFCLCDR